MLDVGSVHMLGVGSAITHGGWPHCGSKNAGSAMASEMLARL